jgi:hypothetical protein
MTLKDWKKQPYSDKKVTIYEHYSTKTYLVIFPSFKSKKIKDTQRGTFDWITKKGWILEIYRNYTEGLVFGKFYPNKDKAMKKALQYMRKN